MAMETACIKKLAALYCFRFIRNANSPELIFVLSISLYTRISWHPVSVTNVFNPNQLNSHLVPRSSQFSGNPNLQVILDAVLVWR